MFDFGKRQKLHTQLIGSTTGNELFKVDEYNTRRKTTFLTGFICVCIFLIEYWYITLIPIKWNILLFMAFIGSAYFCYSNFIQQKRLREKLY